MSLATDCDWCALGDHSGHRSDHGIRPGLIGGTYCDCNGDCVERFQRGAAMFGDQHPTSPVSPGIPEERLAEIEARYAAAEREIGHVSATSVRSRCAEDIPDLLAEVRRQRTEIERLTAGIEEVTAKFEEFVATLPAHIQSQIRLGSSHG